MSDIMNQTLAASGAEEGSEGASSIDLVMGTFDVSSSPRAEGCEKIIGEGKLAAAASRPA